MSLTLEMLDWLRSEPGRRLISLAGDPTQDPFRADRIRSSCPAEGRLDRAAAAVDQAVLRLRARSKLSWADRGWFRRDLLEQASSDQTGRHRTERLRHAGAEVLDLCCGLGADAICMAEVGLSVRACDLDPVAAALTVANGEANNLEDRLQVKCGSALEARVQAQVCFADPGRREGGSRTVRLTECSPTLPALLDHCRTSRGLVVKLSPASRDDDLDRTLASIPHEREWVSLGGECRELLLWIGALAVSDTGGDTPLHRASVLSTDSTITGQPDNSTNRLEVGEIQEYLVEPDSAVIRAHLVGSLAARLGANLVDAQLAYLTMPERNATPFGAVYRVKDVRPFSFKELTRLLRCEGAGDVVLKTRGFAASPEVLRERLRAVLKQGEPRHCPVVFLTRIGGHAMMILGEALERRDG